MYAAEKRVLIKTEKLTKKYKNYAAVNEVTMTIHAGDIYGFIGKNGAGKTTFLRLLTQLIKKSSGRITFDRDMKIGAVIEGSACYPYLSAWDNLDYYAIQRGITDKKRIAEVLEFVGLSDVDNTKVFKDFSLGMRQRLGIGVAILDEPDFLILDEPINGLDPQGIVEVRNIIQRLNKEKGTTILISSHILSELSLIATRYGMIQKGRLIKELTKEELEKECQQQLILETSDNSKAEYILLEKGFSFTRTTNQIILTEQKNVRNEIALLLFKQGIYITNFFRKEQNLENYYLNLLGSE